MKGRTTMRRSRTRRQQLRRKPRTSAAAGILPLKAAMAVATILAMCLVLRAPSAASAETTTASSSATSASAIPSSPSNDGGGGCATPDKEPSSPVHQQPLEEEEEEEEEAAAPKPVESSAAAATNALTADDGSLSAPPPEEEEGRGGGGEAVAEAENVAESSNGNSNVGVGGAFGLQEKAHNGGKEAAVESSPQRRQAEDGEEIGEGSVQEEGARGAFDDAGTRQRPPFAVDDDDGGGGGNASGTRRRERQRQQERQQPEQQQQQQQRPKHQQQQKQQQSGAAFDYAEAEEEDAAGDADGCLVATSANGEYDDEDDRTLLDVFGEAAKEYLTRKVIPPTDASCRWDWRSIRCEPACECRLDVQRGDYHLGRSCRLRKGGPDEGCIPVDPARLLSEKPAAKRFLSLARQTSQIVRDRAGKVARGVARQPSVRFARFQASLCDDLWTLHRQTSDLDCLPESRIPSRSLQERLFCGPVDFVACHDHFDDDDDDEEEEEDKLHPLPPKGWPDLSSAAASRA